MDELIQKARDFLQMPDATREQLVQALGEMITTLQGMPETEAAPEAMAAAGMAEADIAALKSYKSALVGNEAATNAEAIAVLEDLRKALTMPKINVNIDAAKGMKGALDQLRQTAPVNDNVTVPKNTGNSDNSKDKGAKKSGLHEGAEKGSRMGFNISTNRKPESKLITMLSDVKAGKSQSYQIGPSGGYLMRHEIANEFIPALRDAIPLYDMGVDEYLMEGQESLTIPVDTTTEFEAHWTAENTDSAESNERVGGKTLYPKPLVANVLVPNKFLTNSVVDYETRVREKVIYRMKRAIMRAALFGTGGQESGDTGAAPRGILYTTGVTNTPIYASNGTDGRRPKLDDLATAVGNVEDSNVEVDETARWLFASRTKRTFTRTTDTTGQPLLRQSWAKGEESDLLGYEYKTSNIIPITATLGATTDCSYIFYGVWRWLALGLSNQFEFLVDPYTYQNKLMTRITAYCYADVAVLRPEAFEVISGVRQ